MEMSCRPRSSVTLVLQLLLVVMSGSNVFCLLLTHATHSSQLPRRQIRTFQSPCRCDQPKIPHFQLWMSTSSFSRTILRQPRKSIRRGNIATATTKTSTQTQPSTNSQPAVDLTKSVISRSYRTKENQLPSPASADGADDADEWAGCIPPQSQQVGSRSNQLYGSRSSRSRVHGNSQKRDTSTIRVISAAGSRTEKHNTATGATLLSTNIEMNAAQVNHNKVNNKVMNKEKRALHKPQDITRKSPVMAAKHQHLQPHQQQQRPQQEEEQRPQQQEEQEEEETVAEDEANLGFQSDQYRSGFVSILGNPNVGKSTLLNRLLGQSLSIVSPKPQTTRHRILGVLTVDPVGAQHGDNQTLPTQSTLPNNNNSITSNIGSGSEIGTSTAVEHHNSNAVEFDKLDTSAGYQLIFSDTPGMLNPAYKLQEVMQDTVRGAAGDADIILLVTDVYGEMLVDEKIMHKLNSTSRPVIVVINKIDIASKTPMLPVEVHKEAGAELSALHDINEIDSTSIDRVENNDSANSRSSTSKPEAVDVDWLDQSFDAATTTSASGSDNYHLVSRNIRTRRTTKFGLVPLCFEELIQLWKQRLPTAGKSGGNWFDILRFNSYLLNNINLSLFFLHLNLLFLRTEIIAISALKNTSIDALLNQLLQHIPTGGLKYYSSGTLTTRNERFFTSEIIRECILQLFKV